MLYDQRWRRPRRRSRESDPWMRMVSAHGVWVARGAIAMMATPETARGQLVARPSRHGAEAAMAVDAEAERARGGRQRRRGARRRPYSSMLTHLLFARPRTYASPITVRSGMSTCTASFILQTACVVCQAVIFANLWKHHRLLPPTSPRKNYWDVVRAFPARPLHWPYEQHCRSSKLRAPSVLIPPVR